MAAAAAAAAVPSGIGGKAAAVAAPGASSSATPTVFPAAVGAAASSVDGKGSRGEAVVQLGGGVVPPARRLSVECTEDTGGGRSRPTSPGKDTFILDL